MITLEMFRRRLGVSTATCWRWKKRNIIKTVNICGRLYLTDEAVAEFERRAAAGEFASAGHGHSTSIIEEGGAK